MHNYGWRSYVVLNRNSEPLSNKLNHLTKADNGHAKSQWLSRLRSPTDCVKLSSMSELRMYRVRASNWTEKNGEMLALLGFWPREAGLQRVRWRRNGESHGGKRLSLGSRGILRPSVCAGRVLESFAGTSNRDIVDSGSPGPCLARFKFATAVNVVRNNHELLRAQLCPLNLTLRRPTVGLSASICDSPWRPFVLARDRGITFTSY
jgi:hypothetical protein